MQRGESRKPAVVGQIRAEVADKWHPSGPPGGVALLHWVRFWRDSAPI